MKILVLGGTGAMGGPLVKVLVRRKMDVYVTSRKKNESSQEYVHYIQGNALDLSFLKELLAEKYDVIIDFMVYTYEEFRERYELFLNNTDQYIFFSSARVYSDSLVPITENSERLLDVCKDQEYLSKSEYALNKAREEDCLLKASKKNWTIIRPYITYSENRMQLGVMEKEHWLYRALHGRKIVFSEEMAKKFTTLTYGYDVSTRVAELVGSSAALGEVYQILNDQEIEWQKILELYVKTLEKLLGKSIEVVYLKQLGDLAKVLGNYYQIHYDRLYDRKFNSSKVNDVTGNKVYQNTLDSLEGCLTSFVENNGRFNAIDWKAEAYFDRVTREHTPLTEINGCKNKIKYIIFRYTPYLKWKYGIQGN